jgi:RecA-family ATPase
MKTRTAMIKKGLKTEEKHKIGFICFSQIKLDKLGDLGAMEKLIEKHKPTLLVVDTYRRSVKYDENDASKVSEFFVDTMRPLVEKYDISVILIHHNRKSSGYSESIDEMDELRGSSDLANYADIILKLERRGGNTILKQLKNRNAQEEPPIKINCKFEGEIVTMEYEGEYKKQSQAEKCAEELIIWFAERKIEEFTTGDAREIAFKQGFKKNAFHNSLIILQENGDIDNLGRGRYKVLV